MNLSQFLLLLAIMQSHSFAIELPGNAVPRLSNFCLLRKGSSPGSSSHRREFYACIIDQAPDTSGDTQACVASRRYLDRFQKYGSCTRNANGTRIAILETVEDFIGTHTAPKPPKLFATNLDFFSVLCLSASHRLIGMPSWRHGILNNDLMSSSGSGS